MKLNLECRIAFAKPNPLEAGEEEFISFIGMKQVTG